MGEWKRIELFRTSRAKLRGCLSVTGTARYRRIRLARDMWEALGSPNQVVFLYRDKQLGVMAGAGKNSRKIFFQATGIDPNYGQSPTIGAVILSRLLNLERGRYSAGLGEHEGKPIVIVDLDSGEGRR